MASREGGTSSQAGATRAATAEALAQVLDWPTEAAVGVARPGGPIGLVGLTRRRFAWASVTKLLTATAVLIAVEEGLVSLDQAAGPPGATLRHLLAHASGLPLDGDVAQARPGTKRIYSNAGIELAAGMVARESGMSFGAYLSEAVIEPLGLDATTLEGSPAWGAVGPLDDLLAFGRHLLAPTILAAETLAIATTVAFPDLAGVLPGFGYQAPNDWGLGFELRDGKRPHWTATTNSPATFGHFGRSGSFLWVDPALGLVCAGLAGRDFGPWAARAWPRLSDAVVAASAQR
jgi:CubicO group peptidase (beta-lactamase class C family)